MRRKRHKKTADPAKPWFPHLRAFKGFLIGRPGAIGASVIALTGLAVAGSAAVGRLDERVNRALLERQSEASVEFIDLPESLMGLVGGDLRGSISELLEGDWTEDSRCKAIADRLSTVGWIAEIRYVRRTTNGRFQISARYRLPSALVAGESDYVLIDTDGVRLPGVYVYHPRWYIIDGVEAAAPAVGEKWPGADLRAGMATISALRNEPFRPQIVGVVVENFAGRRNPRASHIELITDRPGGRIHWGSAPGSEVEENLVSQKLALLRQNFLQTGRADAGHEVIDVSTFADRYHIPG